MANETVYSKLPSGENQRHDHNIAPVLYKRERSTF